MARYIASRFFYGWVVVAAGFMVTGISYGMQYSFGVFFKPILEEFGWTRAMISGVFSVYMVVHGMSAVVMGGLTDKYGPRIVVAIGGLLMGSSLIINSQIENIWQLYMVYGVLFGIGMGIAYVPLQSTVSKWFVVRKGLAIGIVAGGSGFGTLILSPLAAHFIINYSWRNAYIIFGILTLIIIISSAMFLRRSPQDIGLFPDGRNSRDKKDETQNHNSQHLEEGVILQEAIKTSAFWMIIVSYATLCIPLGMVMVHLVPHSIDIGISKTISAVFIGSIGGFSVFGRIIMGSVADKIGGKRTLLICIGVQLLSILWLQLAVNPWMFYLFTMIFGFSYGGWVPLFPFLAGEIFGLRSLGLIIGVIICSATIGSALGPLFAGYIYDISGSYKAAFIGGAIFTMIAFFVTLFMRPPIKKITAE